jgi:Ca2+/Na+ antiporter
MKEKDGHIYKSYKFTILLTFAHLLFNHITRVEKINYLVILFYYLAVSQLSYKLIQVFYS